MTRVRVVILPTVAEQVANGDHDIVFPKGVRISKPEGPIPVFMGFEYRVPDDLIGYAYDLRHEDDGIVADIEITEDDPSILDSTRLSGGFTMPRYIPFYPVSDLMSLSLISKKPDGE